MQAISKSQQDQAYPTVIKQSYWVGAWLYQGFILGTNKCIICENVYQDKLKEKCYKNVIRKVWSVDTDPTQKLLRGIP